MDFTRANELAERISRDENGELYETLVRTCIPYLLSVKSRFGFHQISNQEVRNELAADAVSDSIALVKRRNRPFTICLQNTFRDCCRQMVRSTRKPDIEGLAKECGILNPSNGSAVSSEQLGPETIAQQREELERLQHELRNHEEPSRTIIYERMRGSPYKEIAEVLGKTAKQCRALFKHDLDKIRDRLRPSPTDDGSC